MISEPRNFQERLGSGLAFEPVAAQILIHNGWPVQLAGRGQQMTHGDTMQHIEIKNDTLVETTGNLFIETRERRHVSNPWRDAGIYDKSDPWLLAIGNERKLWILSVNQLRHWARHFRYHIGATSEGFLLPAWWADKHAVRVLANHCQGGL